MINNKNCIIRLSRYKSACHRLKSLGFVKVFSDNLADAVGVMPSQVRKDFSIFGISGNRRGGYVVDELVEKLNSILGKNETYNVIIVGAGNIGNALLKYKGFVKEGIKLVACFDIRPGLGERKPDVPILSIEDMPSFIRKNTIQIAIIAVPENAAQEVVDTLVNAGVKGLLNFAPIRLRVPETVVVNNVNIELELENLIYFVNSVDKAK